MTDEVVTTTDSQSTSSLLHGSSWEADPEIGEDTISQLQTENQQIEGQEELLQSHEQHETNSYRVGFENPQGKVTNNQVADQSTSSTVCKGDSAVTSESTKV